MNEFFNNYKYFKFDIQLFAEHDKDQKTEEPTEKRRKEAREKGQVLQSREINSALVLLITFLFFKLISNYMYENITHFTRKVFINYTIEKDLLIGENFWSLSMEFMFIFIKIVAPILFIVAISGIIASYMQVGFLFSTESLKPKLSKLNPIEGFKKLFSAHALMEMFKSIFKISVVCLIVYFYLNNNMNSILLLLELDITEIVQFALQLVINLAVRISLVLVVLALIDYLFQWKQHEKSLKMTKQEVKEEYKQMEGNPEIKGKLKQKRKEISMRRMMSDIPDADVVITNPTHYSIVIKYDAEKTDAPVLTAKGQDYIALRIREIAKENDVEIVENKSLARALYYSVDIGDEIPQEFFQAVAEVLAFVYSLKGKAV